MTIRLPILTLFYDVSREKCEYTEIQPDVQVHGSKACNLAFLSSLPYVRVPVWISISSSIFREIVQRNVPIRDSLQELYREAEKYSIEVDQNNFIRSIFKLAASLRQEIEKITLPDELVVSLATIFNHISRNGQGSLAVRSSALTEDLPGASFAGLYDSFLHIRDISSFHLAIKNCWASTFTDRAVQYYMQKGISLRDVFMSLVVMELIPAEISGTAFTTDITTGYNGLHIMASQGLGAVVGGEITADSFLVHPETQMILKSTKGSKEFRYVPKKEGSGLDKVPIPEGQKCWCITIEQVKKLASQVQTIGSAYQGIARGPVDTEFVISKEGTIYFVQIRPVVMMETRQVDDVDFEALGKQKPKQIAAGKHSVFGVKHGKIKIVEDFHDLESGRIQIYPHDIVVTTRTENQWTQYLSQFSGIITTEGNPTSHPVLISRERKVPCLVGVVDALGKCRAFDGQWVTLDGFRNCVYLGQLPLQSISIDKVNEAFTIVKEERLQEEQEMIQDLFKKGFMMEAKGKYWITGINSHFSGALLDMVANAYRLREHVINKSGIAPQITFQTEQMVVRGGNQEGKVYDNWWTTHEEQLKICKKMTLENCRTFYLEKEKKMKELLHLCQEFDLSLSSWKKIRMVYEELTAYQLLGFLERYPLIHSTYEFANTLQIPRLFFEEYSASIPEYEEEEDVLFMNETKRLSFQLLALADTYQESIHNISISFIQKNEPQYYKELVAFTRQYKFSKSEDWLEEPSLEKALKKLQDQVKTNDFESIYKKSPGDAETQFFIDCPELQERIRLCIVKKLQQNNIHHIRQRAHWMLKDTLLYFGEFLEREKVLSSAKEILVLPILELEQLLGGYGALAKKIVP